MMSEPLEPLMFWRTLTLLQLIDKLGRPIQRRNLLAVYPAHRPRRTFFEGDQMCDMFSSGTSSKCATCFGLHDPHGSFSLALLAVALETALACVCLSFFLLPNPPSLLRFTAAILGHLHTQKSGKACLPPFRVRL